MTETRAQVGDTGQRKPGLPSPLGKRWLACRPAASALPVVFILIWSSGYLVGTIGTRHAAPLPLVFWRTLLALVVLAVISLATRAPWPTRLRDYSHFLVIGILLQTVLLCGTYLGLQLGVSAGLSSLVLSASPLIVAAAAVPLFAERLSRRQWAGLGIGLVGVGISLSDQLAGGGQRLVGYAFTGLALLAFVAGTLYQKRFGASVDLRTGTTIQLLGATVTAYPLAALLGGFRLPLTVPVLGSLAWLALVNSIGTFILLFILLRRRSGGAATSLLYLVPPVTALLGVPILGQSVTANVFLGMARKSGKEHERKDCQTMTDDVLARAREASRAAPPVGDDAYRSFLQSVRRHLDEYWPRILEANGRDVARARDQGLPGALIERLRLTEREREALDRACASIERDLPRSALAESLSSTGSVRSRRMLRPLGVILMIFEARPEISLRCALMCGATGNAVLLRGGSEIGATSESIARLLNAALTEAGLPRGLVTVLDSSDRRQLRELLKRDDAIDVVIPRGSPSLIEHCRTASRIPLIASGGGANHLYVHRSADPRVAAELALDSKLADPAACTALEMVLADDSVLDSFLAALAEAVADQPDAKDFRVRVPGELTERIPAALARLVDSVPLAAHDNGREFLGPTLAIRSVPGIDAAVRHVSTFGSAHTEGVVASDAAVADEYCRRVDAAAVVVNGPLRLNDAPTLGMGVALAISTGRLHVRGPVTMDALFTQSLIVDGAAYAAVAG